MDKPLLKKANIRELFIKHRNSDKEFWVAAHRNIKGGYELFLPKQGAVKSCISPKCVSWIQGKKPYLIITESVIDALAAEKIFELEADLMALNSINLAKQALFLLNSGLIKYKKIQLALDDDSAGKRTTEFIVSSLSKNLSIQMIGIWFFKTEINKNFKWFFW